MYQCAQLMEENLSVCHVCVSSYLVVNLNGSLYGVSGSFGVTVDVIETKPRHTHVREVKTCRCGRGG